MFVLFLLFGLSYQTDAADFPLFLDIFCFCFLLTQCTQSTKDVLERAVHSFDFHDLCPPGTPKTTPLGLEVSNMAAPSPEPSASVGCSRQDTLHSVAAPCPPFSRSSKRDSLHSINPAFRLASPSPSLSRATLILGDALDVGVIPLSWVYPVTIREQKQSWCICSCCSQHSSVSLAMFLATKNIFHTGQSCCVLPFGISRCHSDELIKHYLKGFYVLWVYIYMLYVSFRRKVNLSNTWKHNIEIFF